MGFARIVLIVSDAEGRSRPNLTGCQNAIKEHRDFRKVDFVTPQRYGFMDVGQDFAPGKKANGPLPHAGLEQINDFFCAPNEVIQGRDLTFNLSLFWSFVGVLLLKKAFQNR